MAALECSICVIIAQNDEMENCNKAVQYQTFRQLRAAPPPSAVVEVPCGGLGGHAGMMDSLGLVGHKATWEGMVRQTSRFVMDALAAEDASTA